MSDKKREKKSESLEVRLPWSVKRAFMRETKRNGETASDAVRRFIDQYLEEAAQAQKPTPLSEITMTVAKNPRKTLAMTLSAAATAFTIAALPSAADESGFDVLDKNKNGVIEAEDIGEGADVLFSVLDKNGDNQITRDEFGDVKAKVIKTESGDKTVVTRKISVLKVDASEDGIDDPELAKKIVKRIEVKNLGDGDMDEAVLQALIKEALDEASTVTD